MRVTITVFQDLSIIGRRKNRQPYDYEGTGLHTGNFIAVLFLVSDK